MTRVAIIGNAGGGKSVLARYIAGSLQLPLHVIDDVQWDPGWQPAPLSRVAREHARWIRNDRWVIDGWGSFPMLRERFDAADTIVFIDLPLWVHLWWATKRHLKAIAGIRQGWPPEGCDARGMFTRLVRLMWRVHHEARPTLVTLLRDERIADRVVHVRSRQDLARLRSRVSREATR